MKQLIELGGRIESKQPPFTLKPNLAGDLGGVSRVDQFLRREVAGKAQFPVQLALALYLLLIASLWPGDPDRLLIAARIFSGALNFLKLVKPLDRAYVANEIGIFNRLFFSKIGDSESLLFCPSAKEFYRET